MTSHTRPFPISLRLTLKVQNRDKATLQRSMHVLMHAGIDNSDTADDYYYLCFVCYTDGEKQLGTGYATVSVSIYAYMLSLCLCAIVIAISIVLYYFSN